MKPKIFVTTGSVLEFDSLIKILDNINEKKEFEIVAQVGNGTYKPKNIETFKFTKDIQKYYDWADLIITHTGVGTLTELTSLGKKTIAIPNPKGYKEIYEVAKKFDELNYLKYLSFKELEKNNLILKQNILDVINPKIKFKKYKKEGNKIIEEIVNYLNL